MQQAKSHSDHTKTSHLSRWLQHPPPDCTCERTRHHGRTGPGGSPHQCSAHCPGESFQSVDQNGHPRGQTLPGHTQAACTRHVPPSDPSHHRTQTPRCPGRKLPPVQSISRGHLPASVWANPLWK
uniref:Uncharacterized protein n=1 Tax=Mustela putorius furo TaxID=9669 RepID=M3XUU8_MUSPF